MYVKAWTLNYYAHGDVAYFINGDMVCTMEKYM